MKGITVWWNWLLLAIATVISAMIVDKLNMSNWYIIPIVLVVWVVCYLVIWVLNIALLLLPFLVIGGVVWFLVVRRG
jgi:hypothetical protein